MTDIQQARDVLKKRREEARSAGPQNHFWWESGIDHKVKPLIILTAGNPELLDAIETILHVADRPGASGAIRHHGDTIAAAIIAADERMSA